MNGQLLHLSDEVCHLGHNLSFNLCDRNDILRATKDFNRKLNYILTTFNCVDQSVKSFLVKSFCLSLYGCNIWSLSSPDLNILQVAVNHLLRRIWRLPCQSHSTICHCLSLVPMITVEPYNQRTREPWNQRNMERGNQRTVEPGNQRTREPKN